MDQEIQPQPITPATPISTPAPVAPAATPAPQSSRDNFSGQSRGRRMMGGNRRGGGNNRGRGRQSRPTEKPEFDSKPIDIARVARVTKGGKRFSFRTTVVIGDGKGRVGVGMAKGKDVAQSIQKATAQARKHLITIQIVNGTIPYQTEANFHGAVVILKPAKGGVKAGGPVRIVAKLVGITSLTGKLVERTSNKINIAMATIEALRKIRTQK
ncbi:MAG: 30S ribosomal protein S5 [Patescibacteria group bacterium]|mgnify:CR=1 FL=1